ncbi:MAG: hypothetical protein HFP78_04385 [Methylococcales symbiont of Hymedesmia sp. n. MRB-2018]|nr:MAG: hypothetical protein HFP78_04385 [Methylococcales symbiont of Hymedesmia sp. n. MRB-2018]
MKLGTTYKNICLTFKDEAIECEKGKSILVLKTCFLKKVSLLK